MKKVFALATIVALIVAVSTVAFVPSVRAQVGGVLNTWFHFRSPNGEAEISIGGRMEFTPLHPTYLPDSFQGAGVSSTEAESIELTYHNKRQFVAITQTKAPADRALPAGQQVAVDSQPAVLFTGLEGTFEYGGPRISESADIDYTDGKRLVWYAGDVKVEMLSNLPVEEMLKIAESLVPAEAGEGELPFQPPLELPSGSEGEPSGIQEGSTETNP